MSSRPRRPPRPPASLPGPHAAYLRVYEPVTAFPEPDRAAWTTYARGSRGRVGRLVAEQHRALVGVVAVPPRPVPDEEEDAFVLEVDDVVHVCPVQSRLRSWVALGRFRDATPADVLHAFVPPLALERAEADFARWGGAGRGAASGDGQPPLRILTATWEVPVAWFMAFGPSDRLVDLRGAYPTVVHRTRMSAARRRVARALRTLRDAGSSGTDPLEGRRSLDSDALAGEVAEVGRWLEEFHARSWLELDYAGLARLLGPDGVAEDSSVADLAAAVEALAHGDLESAQARYADLTARWATVRALERAN